MTATRQDFQGKRYYRCGPYYSHGRKEGGREALHRAVWEATHGPVPDGWHVHHKNEDRSDNRLSNLEALLGSEHMRKHMKSPERVEKSRESIKKAIAAAPAWHRSPQGREWHRKQAKEAIEKLPYRTYCCAECGAEFESRTTRKQPPRFCGNNCKMRAFRRRRPGYYKTPYWQKKFEKYQSRYKSRLEGGG